MQKAKLSSEDRKNLAARAYRDPVFFCRFFLAELFPSEIPWVHRGILAILLRRTDFLLEYGQLDKIVKHFTWKEDPNDEKGAEHPIFHLELAEGGKPIAIHLDVTKFTLVMMPRGFSKTTIAGIAVPLYWILYRDCRFAVYVSETAAHATMQLGNVKRQLESNLRVREVFGDLVPGRQDAQKWTEDMIETTSGIVVVARGRGGQIRGLNHDGNRPDRIIVDDVEDKESVQTAAQREKTQSWAYGDLMPALPELKPDATIVALGTLLHSEALLTVWAQDPEWTAIRFGALDKDGEPLWRHNLDREKLERKRVSFARAAKLNIFYMEYFNQIRNDEVAKFKSEQFLIQPRSVADTEIRAIAIDPAISEKINADFSAIAVVGMTRTGIIHCYEMWGKRGASPREQIDAYFELSERFDCNKHGVESIAFQAALIHLMREEMFRPGRHRGRYFEIIPITHSQKKVTRVEGVLQPRMANSYLTFQRRFVELETQLLDWPNGKMDFPDALAMAITLLDPYAALAADPEKDLAKDEYEPLDVALGGDWRRY